MKRAFCFCLFLISLMLTTATAQEPVRAGSLVIMGGCERYRNREIWEEIRDLAGGKGSSIAVFPTACTQPLKQAQKIVEILEKFGLEPFIVPLATKDFEIEVAACVRDPHWVDRVRKADGVFFLGGRQDRIVDALITPADERTPMLDAIWDMHRRGGVIAGTSAGAAIMSKVMFRDAPAPLQVMQRGVRYGKEVDHGLGFLHPHWMVDQHALVRGRFARTLVAMHSQKIEFGIGIDENTALVVTEGHSARVIGQKGVLIMELSDAKYDPAIKGFNLKNAKLSYLDHGDTIDLATRKVTPSFEKMDDKKLDPNDDDFDPYYNQRQFQADILGNCTVPDLLGRLIDNVQTEAIGLAFDGIEAQSEPVGGFEFRFYRGPDSLGWYTEDYGGEDYTVLNIHLDIRPIRITGPLYTHYEQEPDDPRTMPAGE